MSDNNNPFPKRLPEFSRAVDDSEDSDWEDADAPLEAAAAGDDAEHSCHGNIALRLTPAAREEMSGSETGRLACSTLLVGVGSAACGFLTACVQGGDARIVALLSCGYPEAAATAGAGLANTLSQTGLGDFACFLYRLACNPQVLVCHAMSPVPAADCHAFAASLLSLLDPESVDVAVLTSEHLSRYQSGVSASELPNPLLRCLRTSAMVATGGKVRGGRSPAAATVAELEAPNLLTGLPAELLSVCQMRRIPAIAFAVYLTEASASEAMAAFKPTLACEPLKFCRPSWPKDADSVMERLGTCGGLNGGGGWTSGAIYI